MSSILYYVFYTKDTPYEEEARRTVESFKPFGVDFQMVDMTPTGDWMKNCMLRAPLLNSLAMENPDCSVCMVDADIRAVADPLLMKRFHDDHYDFAAHYRGPQAHENKRYCAGVLMFGPSPRGRAILDQWARMCTDDPEPDRNVREQVYLTRVADRNLGRRLPDGSVWIRPQWCMVQFLNLGEEYNRHVGADRPNDGTVLIHHECSRYHVKKVGGVLYRAGHD